MRSRRLGALRALVNRIQHGRPEGAPTGWQMLTGLPSLVKETLTGNYSQGSKGKIIGMLLAVVYLVSPVDALPEAVLHLAGLVDDAFVMTWLAGAVIDESTAYSQWRQASPTDDQGRIIKSEVIK